MAVRATSRTIDDITTAGDDGGILDGAGGRQGYIPSFLVPNQSIECGSSCSEKDKSHQRYQYQSNSFQPSIHDLSPFVLFLSILVNGKTDGLEEHKNIFGFRFRRLSLLDSTFFCFPPFLLLEELRCSSFAFCVCVCVCERDFTLSNDSFIQLYVKRVSKM